MDKGLDPAGSCEHEDIRAACIECLGKPYVAHRVAPAQLRPTARPKTAADSIQALSGTKDISVPVFKTEPYLDEQTDWLLAQGYPHDLRAGGWLYLRCDDGLRARVRVRAMRWREERPWRTGDDPHSEGAGPGLVFGLIPDTWEPVNIELGDLAQDQRSGFRYLMTTAAGGVVHFRTQDTVPDGDWDPPYVPSLISLADFIIDLSRCDEAKALSAISRLRESPAGGETMADELEKAVRATRIAGDVVARHTKWCHTGGRFISGMDPARSAAISMYGFIPQRLLDSENRPIGEIGHAVADLKHRIESPVPS